jgi:D-alanyl-D-alanine carboxypeptidase/D-alanyl-D-alanine-endopeptidase (penicillin-binding protein 4)
VVGLVAVVPAVALLALSRWADARVDDNEAAPVPDPIAAAPADPPLDNPLLTARRFPTTLSRAASIDDFVAEVQPFLGTLNPTSCVAVSVDGEPIGSTRADDALIPASTLKLVVAAVALDVLGEQFRYETSVVAAAPPVGGVVDGDLVLVGGGDPLLSSDWYPTSNLERYPVTSPTSLDALADQVAAAGVTEVTGGVLGDGSRYDDEWYAPGWGPGVAGLESGPYDALLVNDSRVLGDEQRSADPNEAAARELSRLLEERGVAIAGEAASGPAPAGAAPIASITSAPMTGVVGEMLLASDNNTSELLVKEIGLQTAGVGSRAAGVEAIRTQLEQWGIPLDGVVIADGSGLSIENRLTCAALLGVLQREAVDGPIGTGLPVAAESGALREVFVDHPLAGVLRGKTGTLNNPPFNADPPAVKGLAGYVGVDGGSAIEYALVLNGPTISDQSEYRAIWTGLADVLATYPSGPTPAEVGLR